MRQQTLAKPFSCEGIGLHTGQLAHVCVLPESENSGRYFVRTDLSDPQPIPATLESVHTTQLSTELKVGDAAVRTVEHLLAALTGMGVDNARIEVNAAEVPLLDGSAQIWTDLISEQGLSVQAVERSIYTIAEPIWVRQDDAFVCALPSSESRLTYGIDFELEAIGNQWFSFVLSAEAFKTAIAPARTFGLLHQIDWLRQQGLIQGGSLENALVCGPDGWVNPPLRFSNEPVRHKLLDLVGDLSLLGGFPQCHVIAYKASHDLHAQFMKRLKPKLKR